MSRPTRMQIIECVAMEFTQAGPATKQGLLERARSAGAPVAVISTLEQLPARRFSDIRQLWEELPGIPIGTP
ncbi:MAG: DUF2795 domain-containing protein [Actinomycetota bacterium]